MIQRDRLLGQQLREHLTRGFCRKWQTSRKEEVRNRREAVLVGEWSHELARQRFGSDVHQRSHKESGAGKALLRRNVGVCRDPEVEQLHLSRDRVVHDVVGLEIAMDDPDRVRGVDGIGDLADDRRHFVYGHGPEAFGVFLEDFSGGPLDGQEMDARASFADLDGAHHVGVLHALTVTRFAKKASDGGSILSKLFAEHFDGDRPVIRVLSAKDRGGSAFTYFALERVSGNRLSDEIFAWHAGEPNS